jgi:hypothetical protein
MMQVYQQLGNYVWSDKEDAARDLVKRYMPNGSGIDAGTEIVWEKCTRDRLVFSFGFHHMNEHGYYTGWTQHTAVVTVDLTGLNVKITGRDRNSVKELLHDVFVVHLQAVVQK